MKPCCRIRPFRARSNLQTITAPKALEFFQRLFLAARKLLSMSNLHSLLPRPCPTWSTSSERGFAMPSDQYEARLLEEVTLVMEAGINPAVFQRVIV
jgi:hypothetical protein